MTAVPLLPSGRWLREFVTVDNTEANPVPVTGDFTVAFPAEVEVSNDSGNPLRVSDGGDSLTVDGTVTVGNFPATQPVSIADPVTIAEPVSINDNGGTLTTDGTYDNRYGGGKSSVCGTVSTAGDTTVVTPSAGNRITLYWVSAIADPQTSTNPVITILQGSTCRYSGYAVAHWEKFVGGIDEPVVVNLSTGGTTVAVTIHYTEGP